jgi:F-type H+-transporting ATPase subunit b
MRAVCAFALSLLVAAGAYAGEPEAAGHGGGGAISPFAGDVGNALWTLVVFALLLWVLGKYAWGPVLSGLQGRERFIRESLESAKRNRDESVAKLAEYEARLAGARDEVDAIMAEARRDAEALRQREEQRARTEAETLLDRARREIEIAKDTAVKELYQRATVLATDAASRIIRRELRPEDNARLVAESVAALEQQLGGGRPAGRG